jgi:putative DNA primase/helicase
VSQGKLTETTSYYLDKKAREKERRKEARQHQQQTVTETDERPVITLPQQADQYDLESYARTVWKNLSTRNKPERVFLRGRVPTRIESLLIPGSELPVPVLQPLDVNQIRYECAQYLRWQKHVTTQNDTFDVAAQPPKPLMEAMLATPVERIPLSQLTRIVHAPVVGPTGIVETSPGYHPSTGVYLLGDVIIKSVPDNPTATQIRQALNTLLEPLQDFAFVADQDRAHALALMLLPFMRDCINGQTPLHLVEKPTPGTGGTLLLNVCLTPSLGRRFGKLTAPRTDEEWSKLITATLRNGPAAVVIDNVRNLQSPSLASALTTDIWDGRKLGKSEKLNLPNRAVWAASGNNVRLHNEVARRVVRIYMDTGMETPHVGREYRIPDLNGWLDEHRGSLIHAALVLIRAWFAAGCPQGKKVLGMYESWSRAMGGLMDIIGMPGFLATVEEPDLEGDIEREAMRWFVLEWYKEHQEKNVLAKDLAPWALKNGSPLAEYILTTRERPFSSVEGVALLGLELRTMRNRVYTFQLENRSVSLAVTRAKALKHGTALWSLRYTENKVKLKYASFDPTNFGDDEEDAA